LSLILQLYGHKLSCNPNPETVECLVIVAALDKSSLQRRALRVMKAASTNGIKIEPGLELINKLKKSDDREVLELTRDIWNA
jgi:hypothetical protein